ncbi:hypothetical protein FQN60_013441, partial [Etheostoma spectabile]
VTNYNKVVEAGSDSDDEDKLHIEDCVSDAEDDVSTDALVEEMLQQGDTAVIYPEAPEDEPRQGTPDASVHDENGTPDSFSQLLTCPYCARGYKRYSSLKEHIKYRHEKTEESFNCPECSYSFAYRAQLERHMTVHKSGRDQRHITQSGGNRKFKCTECGKAFKYKHHLKEHLRIHSGEKPYECSNCKKRFSHSGSYSSHISSKKCIGIISFNGRPRQGNAKTQAQGQSPVSPTPPSVLRTQIREKLEHSKPLQEQLPLNQIKTEPVDYEYKPTVMTSPSMAAMNGGVFSGGAAAPLQGTVQAMVLPTVGLVSPISINLADLQNALKVAVDGNIIRQVLENNAKGQGQVNSGLTTGMLHPGQQQLISAISLPIVGQDGNAKIIINYSLDPNQGQLTAHNLKKEPEPTSPGQTTIDNFKSQKLPEDLTTRGARPNETKDKEEKTTKTCLLCDNCPGGLEALHALKHCKKDGLRLNGAGLESESAVAALLSEGGLCNQPKNLLSLLKAYFALNAEPTKDELAKISDSVSLPTHVVKKWFDKMQEGQISLGAPTPPSEEEDTCEANSVVSLVPGKNMVNMSPSMTQDSPTEATPAEVNGTHSSPDPPSPLNLRSGSPVPGQSPLSTEGPLDLSLPKPAREEAERGVAKACAHPFSSSGSTNADEPLNLTCTKKEASALSAMGPSPIALYASQPSAKPLDIEEKHDTGSEGVSTVEEQNDSDSGPPRKKMKKTDSGMYACDLCDKIFQKSSSLLRHKYEHTGEGRDSPEAYAEAPAEMEALGRAPRHLAAAQLDLDERGSSTREDEESEEEEEEDGVVDMDDIQVVQIGDEGGDEEEEEEEEEEERNGKEIERVLVELGEEEKTEVDVEEKEEEADTRQEELLGSIREEEEVQMDTEEGRMEEGEVTEESGGETHENTVSEEQNLTPQEKGDTD